MKKPPLLVQPCRRLLTLLLVVATWHVLGVCPAISPAAETVTAPAVDLLPVGRAAIGAGHDDPLVDDEYLAAPGQGHQVAVG